MIYVKTFIVHGWDYKFSKFTVWPKWSNQRWKFFLSERKLQLVELVRIKLKRDVIYSPRNIFLNIIVFRL